MINQDQLLQKYDDKTANYFLLDVRSSGEYQEGHLPGSINIHLQDLEQNLLKIPRDQHIITICAHGIRSGRAEQFLRERGYLADSLAGGLAMWTGQIEQTTP